MKKIAFFLLLFILTENPPAYSDGAGAIHNHASFESGQVGMSGDCHIEFVIRNKGEYRFHVTDFSRNHVDISNATGTVVINPNGADKEELTLTVDKVLQEFLVAKGKPRKEGEEVYASAKIEIPGKEPIFIEFQEMVKKTSGQVSQ